MVTIQKHQSNQDDSMKDNIGWTCFHVACGYQENMEVMRYLLSDEVCQNSKMSIKSNLIL